MKFYILCLALTITGIVCLPHKSEKEEKILKVKEILDKLNKEMISKLKIGEKELHLEYHGETDNVPLVFVDDNTRSVLLKKATHELYHDKKNHATFTVSKFVDQDGNESKHLRGSVLEDDNELVVEPNPTRFDKRDAEEHEETVRVYRRSLDGRLPTAEELVRQQLRGVSKRQTGTPVQHYVETLVICDFHCYNQHAKYAKSATKDVIGNYIEGYLAHVMNLADLHYKRSFEKDTQLKISLVTKSYVVLTTAAASKFTTDASVLMTVNAKSLDDYGRQIVNGDKSLNNFNTWLSEQREGALIAEFDLAVAFTSANLYTPTADLLGIAPMGGTCSLGKNGVLVEDSGNFASGSTAAHEIAHNLAVEHDEKSNSAACTDEANYVMSTSNKFDNRVNSFYFSTCSISSLKNSFLTLNKFPCTVNALAKAADYQKFVSFIPGQLITGPEQCQRALGSQYTIMVGNKYGGGTFEDDLCRVLWCTKDFQSATAAGYAVEGTSCGNGKWCKEGACVANSAAPAGQCLIDDDDAFCQDFYNKYGLNNVCANFKTGRCCKMCGGTKIQRLSAHDQATFLAGNTMDNVKFLDAAFVPACVDKEAFCSYVDGWRASTPGICGGGYSCNGLPIDSSCRKSCKLC